MRFLDIACTCDTLVNSKAVGREVRVKETLLVIDKLVPSLIRTRSVTPQPEHSAPSTDVEDLLCQVRVVTMLRTSKLINLYNPDKNFLI